MSLNNNINNNSSFISSLEKKGIVDSTKNFLRNALYEKLKNSNNIPEESKLKLYPSNFNIEDQNLYTMFKLEYTIIEDFLIRTKLNFTHSIFNKEIKSIINPLIPLDDYELMSLLGLNLKELNTFRFKWNNSNDSSDLIKSTYLYQILNSHTKLMKIDEECQTNSAPILDDALYSPDVRVGPSSPFDIEIRLKNIEEKYNRKRKEENDIFQIENRLKKYKEEIEQKYEQELKNEKERFKITELSQMRIEERKKYANELEKVREEYEEEKKKYYEECKKLQNELEKREKQLEKEYEERNNLMKKRYEEKEKNLEYKENYLEKKYKNDMDISVQRIKFNEELNSLKESILNTEKDKKNIIKINKQEINPLINNEIDYLKKEIEEIKNTLLNKQPLKNNYMKKDEDKKYNINNIKPSKESVLNSLNLLTKNNNSNVLNKSKSSNSPSGSGNFNNKIQTKNDRRKRLEELEDEEYKLNNQMREDFQKILHGDGPILLMGKDDLNQRNLKNNYEIFIEQYKPKEIYNNIKKNDIEEEKTNRNTKEKNNNENNKYNYNINLENIISNNKNEYNDNFKNNYDYNNKNIEKNNYNKDNINNHVEIKNDNNINPISYNIKNNENEAVNRNNINNINSIGNTQNKEIDLNKNKDIIQNNKDSKSQNNIGGYNYGGYNFNNNKDSTSQNNIGGYNYGGYNFNNNNNNNNNLYNYQTKNSASGSIIEEKIEGDNNNNKKDTSVRKNNIKNSNKYQTEKNAITEDIEGESGGSNNNSKEINKNQNNNINVNKSNKFNNYDFDYNDIIDDKNEIEENINYEASVNNKDDLSDKKKMEMESISVIAKKQEVSESAGGFGGIFQLQSHAGGFGINDKESYPEFELSKGKNNSNNKKGNDKQIKFMQQNKKDEAEDIEEKTDSDEQF